jgi:hypothetical protein
MRRKGWMRIWEMDVRKESWKRRWGDKLERKVERGGNAESDTRQDRQKGKMVNEAEKGTRMEG